MLMYPPPALPWSALATFSLFPSPLCASRRASAPLLATYTLKLPKKQIDQDLRALRRAAKQNDRATESYPEFIITRSNAHTPGFGASLGVAVEMASTGDGAHSTALGMDEDDHSGGSSSGGGGGGGGGSWATGGLGGTEAGGKIPSSNTGEVL